MIMMKDRKKSMIAAYEEVCAKLEARGYCPKVHILDNECSKCIQNYLESKEFRRHHVTPHTHIVNAAEPAVKTEKKIPSHCDTGGARLGLPYPTMEQDAQASSRHTQHVQNIKK